MRYICSEYTWPDGFIYLVIRINWDYIFYHIFMDQSAEIKTLKTQIEKYCWYRDKRLKEEYKDLEEFMESES